MTGGLFPYGALGALLVALGLFGAAVSVSPLRRILAFNLLGGGVFLVFGVVARRGAAAGMPGDPVPQALVITGIVVAFAATALAVTLVQRHAAATAEDAAAAGAPEAPVRSPPP